ncbi:MAG TPA: putative toxin-antitoxin system toxin component, PIN family [Syntrophales bacterium]|nr:putative toxin-antitoxin system toxin component, PIN family [Syntrophales bacterium]
MGVKAVIDTNIWVSALINPHGYPSQLRSLFEAGEFRAVISAPMLEELVDVLQRPRIMGKYKLTMSDIEELVILLEEKCEHVSLEGNLAICRDVDDNLVIETAVRGGAEYLVSRDDDIKHDVSVLSFFARYGIRVTTVEGFLKKLLTNR